jgi:outer membrane lipoprotein SlyB
MDIQFCLEVKMNNTMRSVATFGAFLLALAASTAWAQDTVRVRGTIERVDGQTLVVKARDGSDLKVVLPGDAQIVGLTKASLSDIKQGSFVGVTGMPQPDGSQKAVEVHIFPEAMRGTGEGHRPWDLQPQSTMTNANVEHAVTGVNGQTLTLKYKDGEKKIIVSPDTPIVAFAPGDKSELKPGVKIFIAAAKKEPDGTLQAPRVNFGKDGLTPPM